MDQNAIKKEAVAAPSLAAAPVATAAPAALPVATTPAPVVAAADANKRPAPVGNGSLATAAPAAKKPNTATVGSTTSSQKSQLQQQIQQQLQQQLQAQLQAAAARGQQANITPEQIQAQAQAMVQAAAQAQAVVAAAKTRGDGLVPMNQSQIHALSQIQAQAIVHARKSQGTAQQIQTQIQLQAQALVHAHTQAQIAAGIYKGDETPKETSTTATSATLSAPVKATSTGVPNPVMGSPGVTTGTQASSLSTSVNGAGAMDTSITKSNGISQVDHHIPQASAPSSSSPQFLAQLNSSLDKFWKEQLQSVQELKGQTEQDFKTHNDLPLARIKRIMKSDEDVRMISAEAPVLFAKACELFILDLSIRSWNYSQLHKRRTLQKEDIREAIQKTDIFDFLVDVI